LETSAGYVPAFGIFRRKRIPNSRGVLKLRDLTNAKYNIYKYPKDENIQLRTINNNLMLSENKV
jgi:hypothetical protein